MIPASSIPIDDLAAPRFGQFMADDLGTVRKIYALAGLPFTPDAELAMQRFIAANPRCGEGKVQ